LLIGRRSIFATAQSKLHLCACQRGGTKEASICGNSFWTLVRFSRRAAMGQTNRTNCDVREEAYMANWWQIVVPSFAMALISLRVAGQSTGDAAKADSSSAVAVDPMAWTEPTALPAIVSGMNSEAYHKAFVEAIAKLDPGAMQGSDGRLPKLKGPISVDTAWNPQFAYWNSANRNAKWDNQMFIACTVFDSDPALAQAALHDAHDAGYRGWLVAALSARIAYNQWRFDDALKFGSFALADAPDDRKPVIARWMYAAAKADYQFEEAMHLAASYPLVVQDEISRLRDAISIYRAGDPQARPEPLAAISALVETDLGRRFAPIKLPGSVESPSQIDAFEETGKLHMQAPPGEYQLFAFGPKAANIDFSAHFQFGPQGPNKTFFDQSLKFAIVDPSENGPEQCEVAMFAGGMVEPQASGPAIGVREIPEPAWQDGGDVRIIVLGPDAEILVDHKRVYYGPVRGSASKRELSFMVQSVGVHADISGVTWKRIETKLDAAAR
jgi:hypothetical protein